jgi:hypothetical protein
MPSPMVHLYIAHEFNPAATGEFWMGAIAPDYSDDRELKDQIHFRNRTNRMEMLRQMKNQLDEDDPFAAGWLLHLFVDARWDEEMITKYHKINTSKDWFLQYRKETALISFYLFHHMSWTDYLWKQIQTCISEKMRSSNVMNDEMISFCKHVYQRHNDSPRESESQIYTFERIKEFTKVTITEYNQWLNE